MTKNNNDSVVALLYGLFHIHPSIRISALNSLHKVEKQAKE